MAVLTTPTKKATNARAKSIGEQALKNTSSTEEAARYVNQGAYPRQGFRAHYKDALGTNDLRPTDWAGQHPKDQKWLIIHASQDQDSTLKS